MSAKYTPGPWKAGRPDMATYVDGVQSKWIYAGKRYLAIASGTDVHDWNEVMANAHLIAAAPELLEALRAAEAKLFALAREFEGPRFTDRYGDGPEMRKIADQARAAIAKATGTPTDSAVPEGPGEGGVE